MRPLGEGDEEAPWGEGGWGECVAYTKVLNGRAKVSLCILSMKFVTYNYI